MPKPDHKNTEILNAILAAQMSAMAAMHIVRELMIDVAKLHSEPRRYVDGLFDRVIRHLDPDGSAPTEYLAEGQARAVVEVLFRDASLLLDNRPPAAPGGGANKPG